MCTMRQRMSNGVILVPLHEHQDFLRWCMTDTPKGGKGALLTRAISFKDKVGRQLGGGKSPLRHGELEKPEPPMTGETLNRKANNVWFALAYLNNIAEKSNNIVEKSTMDMLPRTATELLEAVRELIATLKPKFTNQNSSAVSSVFSSVHHSLAELVRWSDKWLLYKDDADNTQDLQEVVQVVKEAVQALIDLAADKENLCISDSSMFPSTINNNSLEKPPACYSNRNSEISNHRNSLPEIKQESPIEQNGRYLLPGDNAVKLSHSRSSDSILTGVEVEAPPPKPPLTLGADVPPPLPPKRKHPKGTATTTCQDTFAVPLQSTTSPSTQATSRDTTASCEWLNHSHGTNSLSTTLERSSLTTTSSDQVSPASSLDSMNQPHDDPPASRTSLDSSGSLQDRPDLAISSDMGLLKQHINKSMDTVTISIGGDSGSSQNFYSSSSSMSSSSSSQFSKRSSQTVCIKTHTSSSQVYTYTSHHHTVSCTTATRSSTSSSASSSSSASEGDKCDGSGGKSVGGTRWHDRQQWLHPVRAHSTYDNLEQVSYDDTSTQEEPSPELPPKARNMGGSSSSSTSSGYESRGMSVVSSNSSQDGSTVVQLRRHQTFDMHHHTLSGADDCPPPLPEKKKLVHHYMEVFGKVGEPNPTELLRHSVHQMHLLKSTMESYSSEHDNEFIQTGHSLRINIEDDWLSKPPALPPKRRQHRTLTRQSSPASSQPSSALAPRIDFTDNAIVVDNSVHRKSTEEKDEPDEVVIKDQTLEIDRHTDIEDKAEVEQEEEEEEDDDDDVLYLFDVMDLLVLKKEGEEGPVIRGGQVDALIVHAAEADKKDFLYQEAFLTTYRTFISPDNLIHKLLKRYDRFISSPDIEKQKAAKNAFVLLICVVADLAIVDLSIETLETLTNFEYGLLCRGELRDAKALRLKIVEKFEARKKHNTIKESYNIASLAVTTRNVTLLDFKSQEIAEQMTLLDAELFFTMEIPEVLLYAQDQNEERAPNLTKFTEHFNKMSYWARTRILEQEDAKDRERYFTKFTKIMKHLRKMNNFNSYLAILSALVSAPITRLEWQKNITDALKEYCLLIDTSCSFRAYRQALSDSKPPCIPYIGLILQDLTFVHIGNNDRLSDDNVNFSKRWQQYHILEDNMKRFKKGSYDFKKNEKIITFLNDFDNYSNEDALWYISEKIKPLGGRRRN